MSDEKDYDGKDSDAKDYDSKENDAEEKKSFDWLPAGTQPLAGTISTPLVYLNIESTCI